MYNYTYTDTFAGEANFNWQKTGTVEAKNLLGTVRKVKKKREMSGVKCKRNEVSDGVLLVPSGTCTVLMIFPVY